MIILAVICIAFLAGYRINTTPSYPIGLYKLNHNIQTLETGDMIAFCPQNLGAFKVANERDYLEKGICESGFDPLVKKIVAMSGDIVTVEQSVSVNGILQVNSTLKPKDIDGRDIPRAESQLIQKGQYFVMSEYNPNSFDSRYFGPIPEGWIYARAEPIWVVRR